MNFGYELTLDLKDCSYITRFDIQKYAIELCDLIKMKRFGAARVVYFGEDRFKGYTLVQLITTSNVTGHFMDNEAYINVFSCKKYNKNKVISFTKKFFKTKKCTANYNIRGG